MFAHAESAFRHWGAYNNRLLHARADFTDLAGAAIELDRDREHGEDERVPQPHQRIKSKQWAGEKRKPRGDERQRTQPPQRFPKEALKMFSIHEEKLEISGFDHFQYTLPDSRFEVANVDSQARASRRTRVGLQD